MLTFDALTAFTQDEARAMTQAERKRHGIVYDWCGQRWMQGGDR